ncbi:hypothetical protein [Affinibrenneria salicis]|uniref:hypothetical protein n=1 Tax=Affinibrenneria salicis TaxID=2590031 RepID=UPI00168BA07B|nr:hypothetical protein [Affinibrenneria salicis]
MQENNRSRTAIAETMASAAGSLQNVGISVIIADRALIAFGYFILPADVNNRLES